jgi:hypothetical protein
MSDEAKPLDIDNIDYLEKLAQNTDYWWTREDVRRLIATIRERDARIAEITIENSKLMNRLGESPAPDDALRAELDAANTKIRFQEIDLNCARKERDTGYSMAEAAKERIAELEAYKAGIEALPVRRYTWANGFTQDSANGRFIPAEGE